MSVLEKATQHFRSKLDGSLEKIRVDEWETDVYYYPTTPLKDESTILKLQNEGKTVEALVQSLIVKCRNADGSKMFAPADRITLLNEVDPDNPVPLVFNVSVFCNEPLNVVAVIVFPVKSPAFLTTTVLPVLSVEEAFNPIVTSAVPGL